MNPLWLVYCLMVVAMSVSYVENAVFFQSMETDRTKNQLEYAVNSASDSAIIQLQETSQLTPTGNTYVDPEFIWKVYKYTFLRSNNLWSEEHMKKVENSFPSVVISVNDGYYMRLLVDQEGKKGTEKHYRFTQKLPYARTTLVPTPTSGDEENLPLDGINSSLIPKGTVVSDTLDGSNIVAYSPGLKHSSGNNRSYQMYQQDGNKLENKIGSAHDLVDINKLLLESIDYTMYYNSSNKNKSDHSMLTVPDSVSDSLLSPSVSFVGPTIFAFSDNFNLKGKSYFNYYSVGGSQVVDSINYYAYIREGKKYYSRLNPTKFKGDAKTNFDQIYSTAQEAAEEGYSPDPLYY